MGDSGRRDCLLFKKGPNCLSLAGGVSGAEGKIHCFAAFTYSLPQMPNRRINSGLLCSS